MSKRTDTARTIVTALNDFMALDPRAIRELMRIKVPCKEKLAKHPFVQVGRGADDEDVVGLLGILNGIVGTESGTSKGRGLITAVYDANDMLVGFKLTEDVVSEKTEVLIRKQHGTNITVVLVDDRWVWEATEEPVESDIADWIRRTLEGQTDQKFLGMEIVLKRSSYPDPKLQLVETRRNPDSSVPPNGTVCLNDGLSGSIPLNSLTIHTRPPAETLADYSSSPTDYRNIAPKVEPLDLFHELSDYYWSAGWLVDLDKHLWKMLHDQKSRLKAEHRLQLQRLVDAGIWCQWEHVDEEPREVPLEEWRMHVLGQKEE